MFMKGFNNQFSQVVPHLNVFETVVGKLSLTTKSNNKCSVSVPARRVWTFSTIKSKKCLMK